MSTVSFFRVSEIGEIIILTKRSHQKNVFWREDDKIHTSLSFLGCWSGRRETWICFLFPDRPTRRWFLHRIDVFWSHFISFFLCRWLWIFLCMFRRLSLALSFCVWSETPLVVWIVGVVGGEHVVYDFFLRMRWRCWMSEDVLWGFRKRENSEQGIQRKVR